MLIWGCRVQKESQVAIGKRMAKRMRKKMRKWKWKKRSFRM